LLSIYQSKASTYFTSITINSKCTRQMKYLLESTLLDERSINTYIFTLFGTTKCQMNHVKMTCIIEEI
jgi:hypothetical protein